MSLDFAIPELGPRKVAPPSGAWHYVRDEEKTVYDTLLRSSPDSVPVPGSGSTLAFELAGPRERIYFDPAKTRCGILCCGELCPGLNDVIRAIVLELHHGYGVNSVDGFRFGYEGLMPHHQHDLLRLDPQVVSDIHQRGGSILESSRGAQSPEEMVDTLERLNIQILFCIGSDEALLGALALSETIQRRGLKIAVIAVPKTIDNDIPFTTRTFGFETGYSIAADAIRSAHLEAAKSLNGVGLVKLMGRHAGFVAAHAALAGREADFLLVPEVDFELGGDNGFLTHLCRRIRSRKHAVVVVAEGAGQNLLGEHRVDAPATDASGNVRLKDVGVFLQERIREYFRLLKEPINLKYIDPGQQIRSAPATPSDSLFAGVLGQMAVHAGMAGKTAMFVGYWNDYFTHVPIAAVAGRTKRLNPNSTFWHSVMASTGQPPHMTNAREQIHERNRTEEQHFQQLFDHMRDGVAVCRAVDEGSDFVFVEINEAGRALSGNRREEVVGRRVTEVFPAVERIGLLDVFRRVWRTGQPEGHPAVLYAEMPIEQWVEHYVYKLPSGLIVAIYADISQQRRGDEALRESEERYRSITEGLTDYLYTVRIEDGRAVGTMHDAACEAVTGYTPEEFAGDPYLWICMVPTEDHDIIMQRAQQILAGKKTSPIEHRIIRKDGVIRWVSDTAILHFDSRRKLLSYEGVIKDITDRKRREEEIALHEAQLRQSQKQEALRQLASGVADDFNSLLTVIGGHAEMVQQTLPQDHPARESLDSILHAAAQATEVTKSMLTFSRKFEARMEQVVPAAVVGEASRLLQPLLPQSIELIVEAPQEPRRWALTDRVQLGQAILNLGLNARDAMPDGGRLRISCRAGQEHASQGTIGETAVVYIEVADTGAVIPPELVERIFDPFVTIKPRKQGTGLRLSIAYGIVKNLGGRIEVRSEVGKGSTFTIILPGHAGDHGGQPTAGSKTVVRGTGETLLLADDNPQLLDLLTGALESRGYTIIQAFDGEAMVSLWASDRERIRLIVSDNDMPKRSGLDALLQIRQAGGNIPAILITGSLGSEIRDRVDAGTIVLRKPLHIDELADHIRRMLDAGPRERAS